ncbi:hypothetical protein ACFFGV_06620 [Pontibacillus salicampi]|uniref:DUF2536 family protein n=1 Tax=Pontibacillus salicampi TaxID=1449801 RepID=A0ABV6LLJ4_9BACI
MEKQEFFDITVQPTESLAEALDQLITDRKRETGSYNISVHQVVQVRANVFTVILNTTVTSF